METLARELDAYLLLAHEALKRGYRVVCGDSNEVKLFSRYVGGGVYLYKHWESKFPYPFNSELRRNYYYAGLHQEGLVWHDLNFFYRRMTEKGRSEKLDINFVKGTLQRDLLKEFYPALAPILKVIGSPNFDLMRPEYQPLFEKEVTHLRARWGRFILINTNFVLGNKVSSYTGDFLSDWNQSSIKNVGRPLNEEEQQVIKESVSFYEKLFEEYAIMLKAVSARFPSINFILRPHPSENQERWRQVLAGLPNVHVIFEGSVVSWILASLGMIHTGCTTGIEAWGLRRPVIRYNPIAKENPYEAALPNQFGVFTSSLPELEAQVAGLLGGEVSDTFESQLHILKPYLDSIDGSLSVTRIMNDIDALGNFSGRESLEEKARLYRQSRWKHRLYDIFVRFAAPHVWLTRLVVGESRARVRATMFQKFPGLKAEYIRNFFGRLSLIKGDKGQATLRVERVDANVFYLCREEKSQSL